MIAIVPNLNFGQLPVKRMILPQLARTPRMAYESSQCVDGLTSGMYLALWQHLSTRSAWLPCRRFPESRLATTDCIVQMMVFPTATRRDQPRLKAMLPRSLHRRLLIGARSVPSLPHPLFTKQLHAACHDARFQRGNLSCVKDRVCRMMAVELPDCLLNIWRQAKLWV